MQTMLEKVFRLAALLVQILVTMPGFAQSVDEPALVAEGLQCRGAESTSCEYILSHVRVRSGDPIDEEELVNARFRLSALPNFTSVRIFLERGSERGKANVIVEVTEASPLLAEGFVRAANQDAHVLGGRISHQNLLGSGERLDFSAVLRSPLDGPLVRDTEYASLQYVDPNLLGRERLFLIVAASDSENSLETRYGDEFRGEATSLAVSVGRRMGDFSYLALRYEYFFTGTAYSRVNTTEGPIEIDETTFSRTLALDYGWNSEDDPYFPTQGGRFRASLEFTPLDTHVSTDPLDDGDTGTAIGVIVGYRHTWSFSPNRFWTFGVGSPGTESWSPIEEGFLLSFGHSRSLGAADRISSGFRRGRWYVDGGWNAFTAPGGHAVQEAGLELGLRLNTKAFGMVQLALRATTET